MEILVCCLCKKELRESGKVSSKSGQVALYCEECYKVFSPYYESICDFCSGKPVTVEYPVNDFVAMIHGNVESKSIGSWLACEICENLIEVNERDKLAQRSVMNLTGGKRDKIIERLGYLIQDKFFRNRLDGSKRIGVAKLKLDGSV